jgi:hypothetical protein
MANFVIERMCAEVERIFCQAKDTLSDRRARLLQDIIEARSCLFHCHAEYIASSRPQDNADGCFVSPPSVALCVGGCSFFFFYPLSMARAVCFSKFMCACPCFISNLDAVDTPEHSMS